MKTVTLNQLLTLLGVVLVLSLVVARVPFMSTAILAEFNHNNVPDVFNSLG